MSTDPVAAASRHDIVVIGASAGGVGALKALVQGLAPNFPAAVFVTLHITPHVRSMLPYVLQRAGRLPVSQARDGLGFEKGHVYVAPPDRHLLVERYRIRLSRGPKENNSRPAIDPMFRTAARAYGPRVIAVVLSGSMDDGTVGVGAVKARGGVTIAQLPEEADYPDMPLNAIESGSVDYVVALADIPEMLARLTAQPAGPERAWVKDTVDIESDIAMLDMNTLRLDAQPGEPSDFSCPDCGGVLRAIKGKEGAHFRCQVGHAWSPHGLLASQLEHIEESLWVALRALEEHSKLTARLLESARQRGVPTVVEGLEEKLRDMAAHQERIRTLLLNPVQDPSPEPISRLPTDSSTLKRAT
jgi:two-component system chemotaxis response regulator CheB